MTLSLNLLLGEMKAECLWDVAIIKTPIIKTACVLVANLKPEVSTWATWIGGLDRNHTQAHMSWVVTRYSGLSLAMIWVMTKEKERKTRAHHRLKVQRQRSSTRSDRKHI